MEQFNTLLSAIAGGLIVPFMQWFKTKVINEPFISFLIQKGLAIGFGFLLVYLLGLQWDANMIIITALAIVGTTAEGINAARKQKNGR